MATHELELMVGEAWQEDIYKDTARIHKSMRGDLKEGRIALVRVNQW